MKTYKPYPFNFNKLSFGEFLSIFMASRDDHPGRRGSVVPRRGAGGLKKGKGIHSPNYKGGSK